MQTKHHQQRENNFNLLRLFFASAVVFSHSFALAGVAEPAIWGRTIGNISVQGFFAISGYLICDSFMREPKVIRFAWNRALRIVPGVAVALCLSTLAAFACDHFRANPVPYLSNGPVWTLNWEALCYAGVAALGLIGVLSSASMPAFFAAAWMVYLTNTSNMSAGYLVIAPMLMCFLFGAFLRTIVDRVNLTACGIPAVIALAVSASPAAFSMLTEFARDHVLFLWGPSISGTEIQRIVFLACFPIAVLFVGKDLRPVLKIKNDISYGIYLYGWPVAQVLIYLCVSKGINLHVAPLFAGTFVITLIIAYASWKIIEQPALKLKRRGALNRRLPASGADQVPAAQIG